MSVLAFRCQCCSAGCDCGCVEDCPLLSHRESAESRVHAQHDDAEADLARIRAELRDRLDRCDDHDHGAALGWLCDNHPDLVNEALDETGAPS